MSKSATTAAVCARCQHPVPTPANYCGACGHPLSARPGVAPDLLRTLLEALPSGVFAFDRSQRIRYWSRAMEEFTGVPRREALGCRIIDVLPFLQGHSTRIQRAHDAPGPLRLECLDQREGSGTRTLSFWFGPITLEDGSGALLGVLDDLAGKVRVDDQLIRSERLAAIGELAAGVAHNFNNILAAIGGDAQLLRLTAEEDGLPPAVTETATRIHEETMRGGRVAHDLLSFARGAEPHLQRLSVAAVVEDAVRLIRNHPAARRATLDVRLREDLPEVEADPHQLHQVFFNLLLNALQAMPHGGVVSVSSSLRARERDPNQGMVEIKIHDSGVGIPREQLRRIFDPFYSRRAGGGSGSGLGLTVSLAMVQGLGGDIQISSAEGVGTTVTVSLPILERRSHPRTGAALPRAPRVLLVDDDDEVRRALTALLARRGFTVTVAQDGLEALAAVEEERAGTAPLDAVITELALRGVEGAAVIRRLRRLHPMLPILALSGEANPRHRVEAVEAGADFAFTKPPDYGELLGILEQLLATRGTPQPAATAPLDAPAASKVTL